MTIYSLYYYYPHEEPHQCGFFDDYHLAKVNMMLLEESFALVEKSTGLKGPKIDIEQYNLNDTFEVDQRIEINKKTIEYYKR